jgi:hypothetical protein
MRLAAGRQNHSTGGADHMTKRQTKWGLVIIYALVVLLMLDGTIVNLRAGRYWLACWFGFLGVINSVPIFAFFRHLRCRHCNEVVVGFCGDEHVVCRQFSNRYPSNADTLVMTTITVQTAKAKCEDCGVIRLVPVARQKTEEMDL